jgi:hypothetical protein
MHNPSLAQVRWQAWTAVAYGAKSISYWTTGTTPDPNPKSDYRGGLLELDGRITSKYKAIRQLDAELHALGPALMELDPVAVLQVDAQGQFAADRDRIGGSAQTYDIVTAVDGTDRADCLIGYFKHQRTAEDYLLVVNKSLTEPHGFRIQLGSAADSLETFDKVNGRARLVGLALSSFATPELPPASAQLYRLTGPVLEHLGDVRSVTRAGSVFEYQRANEVLRVDYATGYRAVVSARSGLAAPDFRITAQGVLRRPGWLPGPTTAGP